MPSSPKWMPRNYEEADKALRNGVMRRIGPNTWAQSGNKGEIAVVLYSTRIVEFREDGDIVYDISRLSPTTRRRLNAVGGGVRFYSKNNVVGAEYRGVFIHGSVGGGGGLKVVEGEAFSNLEEVE